MFFKKKKNKCVFCGIVSENNTFEENYGYHCPSLDQCRERLISLHLRKIPLSRKEAFEWLASFREHDVFISSIHHEFTRNSNGDGWGDRIEIKGAVLIGRSFQILRETEGYERQRANTLYQCKVPVTIRLFMNDKDVGVMSDGKKTGKANFFGSYHKNYGIHSNEIGKDPVEFMMDLYGPSEVADKVYNQIKIGLLVKNMYDAVYRERLQLEILKDSRLLERSGSEGLNFSLNTKFRCAFFLSAGDDLNSPPTEFHENNEVLWIRNWVLESMI
jgi:hypothetical protein